MAYYENITYFDCIMEKREKNYILKKMPTFSKIYEVENKI